MTTIKCNGLAIVDGVLSLPDGINTDGSLHLTGCTSMTSLPDGMTFVRSLHLDRCTALRTLPKGLSVDWLYLTGCTSLKRLPNNLDIREAIFTDHFTWWPSNRYLDLEVDLPHSVVAGMLGMRVGQIIDHPWLRDLGISEMTVIDVDHWGDIRLTLAQAESCLDRDLAHRERMTTM